MRLSRGRRDKTPNYRVQQPDVTMFYVYRPCCAHCASGENHRRGVFCLLLRTDGYHKKLRDRKHMRVPWNAICDKFRFRDKKECDNGTEQQDDT